MMPDPEQFLVTLLHTIVECVGRKTENPVITFDRALNEITLQVDGHDQGRFIGKKGIVYWAINTIFWYAGAQTLKRTVKVKLLEAKNPQGKDANMIPFKSNGHWEQTRIKAMLLMILAGCLSEQPTSLKITEPDYAEAQIDIGISKHLQAQYHDPDLFEAIGVLVHAAGRADGCSIQTLTKWT